jgi:hypothetical protein
MQADKGAKKASDKAGKPEMPEGEGASSMHDHGGEAGGHEVIQQMHDEHGPATQAEVKPEGESHTVKTTHEDGHTHTSKGHPSIAHVAEHIGYSVGAGGDGGEQGEEDTGSGADGGSIEEMGLGGE